MAVRGRGRPSLWPRALAASAVAGWVQLQLAMDLAAGASTARTTAAAGLRAGEYSSRLQVLLHADATPDEGFAARELAGFLANASGNSVPVVAARGSSSASLTFAVGYGAATSVGLPAASLAGPQLGMPGFWFTWGPNKNCHHPGP